MIKTEQQYDAIKKQIEQKLSELTGGGTARAKDGGFDDLGVAEDIERASLNTNKETESLVKRHSKKTCDALLAALQRTFVGAFGDCDHCGEAIPICRLLAHPTSVLCVPCQDKTEKSASQRFGGRRLRFSYEH